MESLSLVGSVHSSLEPSPDPRFGAILLGKRITTHDPKRAITREEFYYCCTPPSPFAFSLGHTSSDGGAQASESRLLTLPGELRNRIVAEMFRDVKAEDWKNGSRKKITTEDEDTVGKLSKPANGATPASIIFTCKQLYQETWNLAMVGCTFTRQGLPNCVRILPEWSGMTCNYEEERQVGEKTVPGLHCWRNRQAKPRP